MTVQQLRQSLRLLVEQHFRDYEVFYADEKRTRPQSRFVMLKLSNVGMSTHPNARVVNGGVVKSHPSTAMLELNLYSLGIPIESSGAVAYHNSAVDELAGFVHFLEYPSTETLLFRQKLSILLEGSILDVTAIMDEVEPEYRAMAEFSILFTQTVTDPYAAKSDDVTDATGYFTEAEIKYRQEETPCQTQ